MRAIRVLGMAGVCVVVIGVAAAGLLALPLLGQDEKPTVRMRRFEPPGRGSQIGVSVSDVDRADAAREKLSEPIGASVDEVRSDGPAARAGLNAGDIIIEFDGEKVRSARQFSRLVEETPSGRTVKTTVMRGGRRVDVTVTPEPGAQPFAGITPDLRALERFGRDFRLPEFEMPDLDIDIRARPGRLGITTMELQPQLAEYFGVKNGVLVSSVRDDSAAARAGVKAGDVITSVNGEEITDGAALRRRVGAQTAGDVTLGIVRDRKEMIVKVTTIIS